MRYHSSVFITRRIHDGNPGKALALAVSVCAARQRLVCGDQSLRLATTPDKAQVEFNASITARRRASSGAPIITSGASIRPSRKIGMNVCLRDGLEKVNV